MHGKRKYNKDNIINGQPLVQDDNEDTNKTKDNIMIAETVELISDVQETEHNIDRSIRTSETNPNTVPDEHVTQVPSSRSSKDASPDSEENTYDNNGNITNKKKKCLNDTQKNNKSKNKRGKWKLSLNKLLN